MAGKNLVILVGRLGRDPETRYLNDGRAVTNFSVATSEEWKDKNTGEKKEKTEWHKISVFGPLATVCGKYLSKGRQVYVEGKLQTRTWDKDGVKQYSTEIVANDVQFLGDKTQAAAPAPVSADYAQPQEVADQMGGVIVEDFRGKESDLPF
jgi:single-strand DNA-binding protein